MYPHWIENSHCFWYLKDTENGKQFRYGQCGHASNTVAFDHQALADGLALATGQTINADNLPIKHVTFSLSPTQIGFRAFDKNWRFDTSTARVKKTFLRKKSTLMLHLSEDEATARTVLTNAPVPQRQKRTIYTRSQSMDSRSAIR